MESAPAREAVTIPAPAMAAGVKILILAANPPRRLVIVPLVMITVVVVTTIAGTATITVDLTLMQQGIGAAYTVAIKVLALVVGKGDVKPDTWAYFAISNAKDV